MSPAPVALFLYKRPKLAMQTIDALSNNTLANKTKLFVFIDGPRNSDEECLINETVEVAEQIQGFSSVEIVFARE